jgi:hypothetical protein
MATAPMPRNMRAPGVCPIPFDVVQMLLYSEERVVPPWSHPLPVLSGGRPKGV